MKRKYLFVCKHNFARSKYGEKFLRKYLKENNIEGRVFSAGVGWSSILLGRRVSRKILNGVFRIFVMEDYMKDWIVEKFGVDKRKIVVLNIPDDYGVLFLKKYKLEDLEKIMKKVNWKKYI